MYIGLGNSRVHCGFPVASYCFYSQLCKEVIRGQSPFQGRAYISTRYNDGVRFLTVFFQKRMFHLHCLILEMPPFKIYACVNIALRAQLSTSPSARDKISVFVGKGNEGRAHKRKGQLSLYFAFALLSEMERIFPRQHRPRICNGRSRKHRYFRDLNSGPEKGA